MTQPPLQPEQPPGWVPTGYYPMPPRHREADKVLALGLVGLVGGFVCFLPVLLAPFAWVIGNRVLREIEQSGGRLSGHDAANTGRILGIIGTCLLVIGAVFVGVFVAFFAVTTAGVW